MAVSKSIAIQDEGCPVFSITHLLGQKWTSLVLQEVATNGNSGFNEMQRCMGNISPKIMSQRLSTLEKNGIIEKKTYFDKISLHTSYKLTSKGSDLCEILLMLKRWGIKHCSM